MPVDDGVAAVRGHAGNHGHLGSGLVHVGQYRAAHVRQRLIGRVPVRSRGSHGRARWPRDGRQGPGDWPGRGGRVLTRRGLGGVGWEAVLLRGSRGGIVAGVAGGSSMRVRINLGWRAGRRRGLRALGAQDGALGRRRSRRKTGARGTAAGAAAARDGRLEGLLDVAVGGRREAISSGSRGLRGPRISKVRGLLHAAGRVEDGGSPKGLAER